LSTSTYLSTAKALFVNSGNEDFGKKMRVIITVALVLIVASMSILPARAVTTVGANVDITASNDTTERQQVEPTIAVDPRNPSIIVAGAQDYRLLSVGGHRWHGFYRSTDKGLTWIVSLVPGFPGDNSPEGASSPLKAFQCTSDPVLAFDLNGNVYYTGISCSPAFVLFVVKFTNEGATYAGATIFPPSRFNFADKPWIAVDTTNGLNGGNVYISYDAFTFQGTGGSFVIRSTDQGQTWSTPQIAMHGAFVTGLTVDPQGRVFVSALVGGRSLTTNNIVVTVSTDGGKTFSGRETVATATLPPSPLPGNFFRHFTIPQLASDNNGVYVVWDDYGLGNSNILLAKSTDQGATWTLPIRVNDIVAGQHFFPSIAASGGVIFVIWYDSRNGQQPNGAITGLDVFYAESTNGGASFSTNVRVTSTSFNPNIVERADFGNTHIFMGDYIQVAATPGAAHAIWADDRDACDNIVSPFGCTNQDAFTATITP
jgi:hypothetical protein